jgi:hypothetical protein
MGPICCPETSVGNYHYSLRNDTEQYSSFLITRYFKMQNDGCKVRRNKQSEQFMSVWAVFTVVYCRTEGGKEGRADVGHALA